MSGPAWRNANRSTHRAVVDLVGSFLDIEGIASTATRRPASISESLNGDGFAPDLALDGVDLDVSSRLSPYRLSESLDAVNAAAALRGVVVGAFVQWRGNQEIGNAYVVTSLRSFARLVRGDHLTPK